MGQYHHIVNLDRQSSYAGRALGNGVKLMEQAQSLTSCAALLQLLSNPRRWKGHRIAVIGDYAEDSDLSPADGDLPTCELYAGLDNGNLRDYSRNVRQAVENAGVARFIPKHHRLHIGNEVERFTVYDVQPLDPHIDPDAAQVAVVNHDLGQVLSPRLLGDDGTLLGTTCHGWDGGTGTALFVLLAASCKGGARGGGDIDSPSPLVGSWAGHHLSVIEVRDLPDGLTDITDGIRNVLETTGEAEFTVTDTGAVHRRGWADLLEPNQG